jgi:benzodiazapine receptor
MNQMSEIYTSLTKPTIAPQPEVFGIVWAVLYVLLALASILLVVRAVQARIDGWVVGVLFLNLVANILFTPMFTHFGLFAGFISIVVVLGTAAWLQVKTWPSIPLVFALLLPYTIWVSFALILQVSLLILN